MNLTMYLTDEQKNLLNPCGLGSHIHFFPVGANGQTNSKPADTNESSRYFCFVVQLAFAIGDVRRGGAGEEDTDFAEV